MNDSDGRSIMSYATASDGSTARLARPLRWRNVPLNERCSMPDMVKLKEAFQAAYRNRMQANEFRQLLRTLLNVEYDDEEYKILFMKINTSRTGEVDWDELVSHMLLGYYCNDPENQRESLELPIMGRPRLMRSQHRHAISRICFCPDVSKDRKTDPMTGIYLTASRDGVINWWSLDMDLMRSAQSASPHLKVRTTWVTDMACMPDVNIVVTSSTERDLRFYDITAKTFSLKIVITSWEYMICTMHYHFSPDVNENCLLVCGDVGGNVRVLSFSPYQRGPFQSRAGRALIQLRHIDLQKRPHLLPELKLIELGRVHTEWVRQVSYYASLHCVVSCATCSDSLLMCDTSGSKTHTMFRVDKGILCFTFHEESHILATGGPDCTVRVWSPFVPSKPSVLLLGHRAAVLALVLQNQGQTIYSISRDRVIKVWDVQSQLCLQTYIDIPSELGERTPFSAAYNPVTRELLLASIRIAVLVLDEQLNPLHTDGFTHARAVAAVLYNPLFKVVVTVGMGSIIINWNPLTGKRNAMIRKAHTRLLHGESIPVEITAACYDPGYQLLLSGARDGSLKVWNFNTGTCLRTMGIEHMCEVTSVFWVEGRILAVGWNRHVTEFEDTGTSKTGKHWETRHSEDILTAAVRPPLTLVTGSYNSELVLWKLETGQPYRRFSCTEPMLRIKMQYNKRELAKALALAAGSGSKEQRTLSIMRKISMSAQRETVDANAAMEKARTRRISVVKVPSRLDGMRELAVHCIVFLETRPSAMGVASFMVGLENGQVQAWSDHPAGGFQGTFYSIHTVGDYVSALGTDQDNEFLFCGTTCGYMKVWLMTNYFAGEGNQQKISMPRLRLQFPFLLKDRLEGRAKRCVRDQKLPLLLNSYRAHLRRITSISYINDKKLLLTGSADYSVRIWRLSGEYLQTLGSFIPWTLDQTRIPPDVSKVASFTTFKVWRGGYVSRFVPGQKVIDKLKDITQHELRMKTYGATPEEPLLGSYLQLPVRPDTQFPVKLDDSLPTIPLYTHLRMASTQPVRRPPTPELVKENRLKKGALTKKTHFVSPAPSKPEPKNPH